MKTILVPTDFSGPAKNAAGYAAHLAGYIKAGITLCNAIRVPSETFMAGQVAWPLEDYDALKAEAVQQLDQLATVLKQESQYNAGGPVNGAIEIRTNIGDVTDTVRNIVDERKNTMVVMGMSGSGALSRFFLGSNTQDMIEKANFPVLLIPPHVQFHPVKKIAFATDLNPGDIELIHAVASLAAHFNAEILIAHVTGDKFEDEADKRKADDFLNEVTCKANYPKIYYRHIKSMDVTQGLEWLSEHGLIDMLVMVHRRADTIAQIFGSSYTQKLSHHIDVPLLVLPESLGAIRF